MNLAEPADVGVRWRAAAPFVLVGTASVIAGGLLSAATATSPTRQLAWLVAYLVLVVGVAQIGLGAGQAWLADGPIGGRAPSGWSGGGWLLSVEFALFALGNAGVALGTLATVPVLVDAGGVLLVAALVLFLWGVRRSRRGGWLRYLYRALVVILLLSIPIGLLLAQLRAG